MAAYKELNPELPVKNDAVKERLVGLFSEQLSAFGQAFFLCYEEELKNSSRSLFLLED